MEKTKSFTELIVWQKAHQLVLGIYTLTNDFPKHEIYGLTSQVRRAAVSIAANIAEGYKKKGSKDKLRFFNIAESSLEEVRYYCILIKDLEYADTDKLTPLLDEIGKLLSSYMKKINTNYYSNS